MAFESIPPLPTAEELLGAALSAGRRKRIQRKRGEDEVVFRQKRERERLTTISTELSGRLYAIPKQFPDTDTLSEFYRELISLQFSLDDLRQTLGRIQQSAKVVQSLSRQTRGKIQGATTPEGVQSAMNGFIGRLSSVLKRLDDSFAWLKSVRETLREMPTIKQLPTLCIAGFPNVGKTTLFVELTGSGAEINSYAFTTKRLNTAVITVNARKIQVIDTPGTLNREGMNAIEQQAELALKYVADHIVYVYDPTPTYTIERQDELLDHIKGFRAPVTPIVSKLDLVDTERLKQFTEERNCLTPEVINDIVQQLSKN